MRTLENWLREKPFTMDLSAGFFGFYAHLGVVKALLEAELRPVKWAGCSAGAIVAAAMASGRTVQQIQERFTSLSRQHFWDPHFGIGFLKGEKFEALLSEFLPSDFESLIEPLEIAVFDVRRMRRHALTAGPLPGAIRASGAVPGMFQPVTINRNLYFDGGVVTKTGLHPSDVTGRVFYHFLHSGGLWGRAELMRHHYLCRQSKRDESKTLVIQGLPKVGPFRLGNGPHAIQKGYQETKAALLRPVQDI